MEEHTEHEYLSPARWVWSEVGLPLDQNTSNYSETAEIKQRHSPSYGCPVHILKKCRFGPVPCVCLCVEWIISHGDIGLFSFASKLQNNTQDHLRVLWDLDEFLSLAQSSAQESGCSPKTIFVRVALFQTFAVYYILQPPFLSEMGPQIGWKAFFMFLISLGE